jgi:hypothetical protein
MSKLEKYKELIEEFHVWKAKINEVMENENEEWDDIVEGMDEDDDWYGCVYNDINDFLRDDIDYS